jgi:hypothetical protein
MRCPQVHIAPSGAPTGSPLGRPLGGQIDGSGSLDGATSRQHNARGTDEMHSL